MTKVELNTYFGFWQLIDFEKGVIASAGDLDAMFSKASYVHGIELNECLNCLKIGCNDYMKVCCDER